jgi:protocatechuate 3,4-dioxygenase beta subunit
MRTARIAALLTISWILAAQSQQLPIAISGVVTEGATGQPVPRVSLELRPYQPAPPPGGARGPSPVAPVLEARYPSITNENGQFVFRNIPPGRYTLTASRNAYIHSDYGQRGPNGKGLPLTLVAGQPVTGIQLSIWKAAAISGHVFDSRGVPYPYVQVNMKRVTYTGGRRTTTVTGATYTDDLGQYRIYGLPPGQYVLSADGETSQQRITPVAEGLAPPLPGSVVVQGIGGSMAYTPDPANLRKPQQRGTGAGSVYFRNATDDRDAQPIDLHPGDDLNGMDLTYAGAAAAPVTFSGLGGFETVTLQIFPTNFTIGLRAQGLQNRGDFEYSMVTGSYNVVARGTDSARKQFLGVVAFDVVSGAPLNVKLSMAAAIPVNGRVVLDGVSAGNSNPDLARVSIRARRSPPAFGIPDVPLVVSATGTFTWQAPVDGDYAIEVLSLPPSLRDRYVKSPAAIRVNGQPLNDLEIVLAAQAGQIDGRTVNTSGTVMPNATVVVVPEQRSRFELFKTVASDASARFHFDGITPGKYLLFAWEDIEQDLWYNPEFLRAIEDRGKAITIAEGTRENADLVGIPMR